MHVTRGQAKKLWCPLAHVPGSAKNPGAYGNRTTKGDIPKGATCVADQCMFWRWADNNKDRGFCAAIVLPPALK